MLTLWLHPMPSARATGVDPEQMALGLNRTGAVPSLDAPFHSVGEGAHAPLIGTLGSGVEAVGLTLALVRSGAWAVVLDLTDGPRQGGPGEMPAVQRARRSTGRCALVGPEDVTTAWIEPALQLLGALERDRSELQQDAGRRVEAGRSQREVAAELDVSQQAVHARLRGGLWNETRELAGAVAAAVERIVRDGPFGLPTPKNGQRQR